MALATHCRTAECRGIVLTLTRAHQASPSPPLTAPPPAAEPSPLSVAKSILREAEEAKSVRSRFVSRLLPVTHTCFADLEAIKKLGEQVIKDDPSFAAGGARLGPGDGWLG
jgi:hypothetical protein